MTSNDPSSTEPRTTAPASSADPREIEKFSALAEDWWDPDGKFRPLHRLNPTRLAFIRDRVAGHYGRDALAKEPLAGLSMVDVGCGGGLLSEPLARLGARVTGLDASAQNIQTASEHAALMRTEVEYRHATAEALAAEDRTFDVVVCLEVVEHVVKRDAFLATLAKLTKPGGALVMSTINRTPKAFLLAIVGAEYVLRWIPRGSHDWRRFVRPSELVAGLRPNGIEAAEVTGVVYNPLTDTWQQSRDVDVNYMLFATKAKR